MEQNKNTNKQAGVKTIISFLFYFFKKTQNVEEGKTAKLARCRYLIQQFQSIL